MVLPWFQCCYHQWLKNMTLGLAKNYSRNNIELVAKTDKFKSCLQAIKPAHWLSGLCPHKYDCWRI